MKAFRTLISKEAIENRIKELAKQIDNDYEGEQFLLVAVLRGSFIFVADLIREIEGDVSVDFIEAKSYCGTTTSGELKILKDTRENIEGKNVIIVEDIIDTGITLDRLTKEFLKRKPKSLKICACFDKPSRREVELKGDYIGFEIPNEFVIGYGLDYDEKFRNLKEVKIYEE